MRRKESRSEQATTFLPEFIVCLYLTFPAESLFMNLTVLQVCTRLFTYLEFRQSCTWIRLKTDNTPKHTHKFFCFFCLVFFLKNVTNGNVIIRKKKENASVKKSILWFVFDLPQKIGDQLTLFCRKANQNQHFTDLYKSIKR